MLLLAAKAVDHGSLGLLNQHQLVHLLVLVLDEQVLLLDDLLSLKQLLLDGLVRAHFLLDIDVECADALLLIADLRFVLDLQRAQANDLRFNMLILLLHGLACQVQAVDIVEYALVLRL